MCARLEDLRSLLCVLIKVVKGFARLELRAPVPIAIFLSTEDYNVAIAIKIELTFGLYLTNPKSAAFIF